MAKAGPMSMSTSSRPMPGSEGVGTAAGERAHRLDRIVEAGQGREQDGADDHDEGAGDALVQAAQAEDHRYRHQRRW